jgi:hypothetical protein
MPSCAHTHLRNLKAAALPQQHVGLWHAHVVKVHLGVAVRRVVKAVNCSAGCKQGLKVGCMRTGPALLLRLIP